MILRKADGFDAFQVLEGSSNFDNQERFAYLTALVNNGDFNLVKGTTLEDAIDYFEEKSQNSDAINDAIIDNVNADLAWSEIRQSDNTIDKYWQIESSSSPALYEMS